ncbi:hypothetical protein [Caballeronia grimmiae]|uniref:hypothetical protein n=1 Tax=Caballeronia grimmiae TaxID=1071679 RepID=UPI0038BABB96
MPYQNQFAEIGFGNPLKVKSWIKHNHPHPVVAKLLRRGSFFARTPFQEAKHKGVQRFSVETELEKAAKSLWALVTRSHDIRDNFFEAAFDDVFHSGQAGKALNSVFMRKGWSKNVWSEELVEYSSFRAAIGTAMLIYAIYLHNTIVSGDLSLAIIQSDAAAGLHYLDLEKTTSVKYKRTRQELHNAPKRLGSLGGKVANASYRAGKDRVFKWLDDNLQNYKGRLDDAADEIEKLRIVSLDWRTIRSYITAYRKIQSTAAQE